MKATIDIEVLKSSLLEFEATCEVAIRNLGRGTKAATVEACEEILANSKQQVPTSTKTLFNSAFYEVTRRTDTSAKTYAYEAILGYGGNGDPINPVTGKRASTYMVVVHEDLSAYHPRGKAKFLEDPVRDYAENKFSRTVFKYAKDSLASMSD